ncbi:MAG: hypothetical protein AAGC88_08330 [Bacteroidota bacterium]
MQLNRNWLVSTIALVAISIVSASGQGPTEKDENAFLQRIFLPSIDVGYQVHNSSLIEGALKFATSIEYRFKNNNDFFVRASYDTYGARYKLSDGNRTSNTIEGTVQFSDISFGPGYRLGDKTYRIMFTVMPGIKLYEFPTANINGQQIEISQAGKSIFTTTAMTTLEYYFDRKSAFTFSVFHNRVWQKVDFWEDGRSGVGISIGFITSLL